MTVQEIKEIFAVAYNEALEKKNAHNKKAYGFALQVLSVLSDDVVLEIRETAQNRVFNIGDLVEAVLKYQLGKEATYSQANEKDLNRNRYHEIKTMPASNRYANAVKQGKEFLAVIESGVYAISGKLCEMYYEDFKLDNRTGERLPDLKTIKIIIQENNLKRHKYSELLGL